MHSRRVLPFFFANRTGAPYGEVLGLINPLSNSPCNWTLSSCNSTGAILCGVIEMGVVPWCNSIPKSTTLCGLPVNPQNTSGCRVTRRHFRKSGRVSFVRGALPKYSTCIYLSQTVQYIQYISNTATWAHKQYSTYMQTMKPIIYPIVTRVNIFTLKQYIY